MKKSILIAASALLLASCSSDAIVEETGGFNGKQDAPISFITSQKNITRATFLQNAGHYNFGVFAYKSTETTNNIMDNYLVGYMDETNKKGYYMTTANQTTLGDVPGQQNGKSQWAYERMGSKEYDYSGAEGYYTTSQKDYMSNVDNQYLRYWDKSAPYTLFYAYSPYINSNIATTASYNNSTHKLTIPDGSIKAGYDNPTDCEAMYAVAKVPAADYGKDVELQFKRLVAKVNIKFWEDLDGYSVRILDLKQGTYEGVQAVPAELNSGSYSVGSYYKQAGAVITFSNTESTGAVTSSIASTTSTADETSEVLKFKSPTDAEIGTTRVLASPSETDYYAIPKDNNSGFTFHVSYELTSTTGEKIVVKDATVFVPKEYANWNANTHYTYNFKITTGGNGSTEANPTIDPNSPNVPTEPSLYPIVFDNCTIVDWDEVEHDPVITPGTNPVNYSVVLDKLEVKTKEIAAGSTATVTATLKEDGTAVASPAGTFSISGPDATNVTISTTGVVTVKPEAKTGTYTVKYAPTAGEHAPASSYTASFVVIGLNAVSVSTSEIGTGGTANTTLTVSTSCDGVASTPAVGSLSIEYPASLTADQKNKVYVEGTTVTVEKEAVAGSYKVVYTTDEGDAYAPFEVKNYGLTLSTYEINHNNTDQTIDVTATEGVVSLKTGTPSTISLSGNTITVDKTTAEGTYTVISTVTKNTSVTTYEKTFTVKNVYVLTLDMSLADNDETTVIAVTSSVNAVASTNIVITPADSNISYDSTTGKITVAPGAATGTYTVQLTDGGSTPVVLKEATFIVQD